MKKVQPPWRPGQAVRVLRIAQCDEPHLVIFLANAIGHREHWPLRPPSVPCFGKERSCRHCGKLPLRFYAYAPVLWQDPRTGKLDPWVLQATANCEERLRDRDLRGEVWTFERPGDGQTAEVICRFVEKRDIGSLPLPFSVELVLERMFMEKHLVLGVCNPNPERVIPVIPDLEPIRLAKLREEKPICELSPTEREEYQRRIDDKRAKIGFPRQKGGKT
jgi:hypothetical protein